MIKQNNVNKKSKKPFLSIVFSFYNEIDCLNELILQTHTVLLSRKDLLGFELIFVNDGSNDGSESFLEKKIQDFPNITLINMSRNFKDTMGCYFEGFKVARGDVVIFGLDADLQDPPIVINKMLDAYINDTDIEVVYATREKRKGETWLKIVISSLGYKFLRLILNVDIPKNTGDLKLVSRVILNVLINHQERLPFMRGLISHYGFKQAQIFYEREPRLNGKENTKHALFSKRNIDHWLDSALISFSDVPLKLCLAIGIMISTSSFFYIIFIVIQTLLFNTNLDGWPSLMVVILFMGSSQLIMLGILGLYIKTIFLEVKKRPAVIVKNIIKKNTTL